MYPLVLTHLDIERIKTLEATGVSRLLFVLLYEHLIEDIQALFNRLRVKKNIQDAVLLAYKFHDDYPKLAEADAAVFVRLFQGLDVLRRPERLQSYLECCALLYPECSDVLGRVQNAWQAYRSVDVAMVVQQGHKGLELAKAIAAARTQAVAQVLES